MISLLPFKKNSFVHLEAILTVNDVLDSNSIRVFFIAAVICTVLVLPVNYYGTYWVVDKKTQRTSLEVFTIENVKEGSTW
jgi:uncharacterized membrane protein YidH (DUF202 family)